MQLSAPIYALKRRAKLLARQNSIALHQSLDKVAREEGFRSWSHLVSSPVHQSPAKAVLSQLEAGDLVLVGARPGHGKTLLGLELALNASQIGRKGYFFTLDYHEREVSDRFSDLGVDLEATHANLVVDTSDAVSADYVIRCLDTQSEPALIVVDYLQLLDQKRSNPSLDDQIKSLHGYVADEGAICILISQIDRSFDLSGKPMPDLADVRLPNPLDLSAFRKCFFLHNGKLRFDRAA